MRGRLVLAWGEKVPLEALLLKSPINTRRALFHAMQFLCPPHMVLVGLASGGYKNSLMRQRHLEHTEPAVTWPRVRPVPLSARPSIAGPPLTLARLCWLERGGNAVPSAIAFPRHWGWGQWRISILPLPHA